MNANAEKNRDIPIPILHRGSNWHPKLNIDKKGKYCYPKWDLRDRLVAGLRCEITDRLDAGGIHGEERRNIITELFKSLTFDSPQAELPDNAPELYAERSDKSEKPEDFLVRVYAGLTGSVERPASIYRSHVKAWDIRLYQALYKRRKTIENFDILLPPSQGKSVADLGVTDAEYVNRVREGNAERQRQSRL